MRYLAKVSNCQKLFMYTILYGDVEKDVLIQIDMYECIQIDRYDNNIVSFFVSIFLFVYFPITTEYGDWHIISFNIFLSIFMDAMKCFFFFIKSLKTLY